MIILSIFAETCSDMQILVEAAYLLPIGQAMHKDRLTSNKGVLGGHRIHLSCLESKKG